MGDVARRAGDEEASVDGEESALGDGAQSAEAEARGDTTDDFRDSLEEREVDGEVGGPRTVGLEEGEIAGAEEVGERQEGAGEPRGEATGVIRRKVGRWRRGR